MAKTFFDIYDQAVYNTTKQAQQALKLSQGLYAQNVDHYYGNLENISNNLAGKYGLDEFGSQNQNDNPLVMDLGQTLKLSQPELANSGATFAELMNSDVGKKIMADTGLIQAVTNNRTFLKRISPTDQKLDGEVLYAVELAEVDAKEDGSGYGVRYNSLSRSYGKESEETPGQLLITEKQLGQAFEDHQANTYLEKARLSGAGTTMYKNVTFQLFKGPGNVVPTTVSDGQDLHGTGIGKKAEDEQGNIQTYSRDVEESQEFMSKLAETLNQPKETLAGLTGEELINLDDQSIQNYVRSNVAEVNPITQIVRGPLTGEKTTGGLERDLIRARDRFAGLQRQKLRLERRVENLSRDNVDGRKNRAIRKGERDLERVNTAIANFDERTLKPTTDVLTRRMEKQKASTERKLETDPRLRGLRNNLRSIEDDLQIYSGNKQGKLYKAAEEAYNLTIDNIEEREKKLSVSPLEKTISLRQFNGYIDAFNAEEPIKKVPPAEFLVRKLSSGVLKDGKGNPITIPMNNETRIQLEDFVSKNYNPQTGKIALLTEPQAAKHGIETTTTSNGTFATGPRSNQRDAGGDAMIKAFMVIQSLAMDKQLTGVQLTDFLESVRKGYMLDTNAYKAALNTQSSMSTSNYNLLKGQYKGFNTMFERGDKAGSGEKARGALALLGPNSDEEAIEDALVGGINALSEAKATLGYKNKLKDKNGTQYNFYAVGKNGFNELEDQVFEKSIYWAAQNSTSIGESLRNAVGLIRSLGSGVDPFRKGLGGLDLVAVYGEDGRADRFDRPIEGMAAKEAQKVNPTGYILVDSNTGKDVSGPINYEDWKELSSALAGRISGFKADSFMQTLKDKAEDDLKVRFRQPQ